MTQSSLKENTSELDQGGSVVVLPVNLQRLAYRRQHENASAAILLTPTNVLDMIANRKEFQIIKFRTTCSDPVPNW